MERIIFCANLFALSGATAALLPLFSYGKAPFSLLVFTCIFSFGLGIVTAVNKVE